MKRCWTYTEDDSWCWSVLIDLDHGENLRHLTIHGSGIEQTRGGEQDPINTWTRDTWHCCDNERDLGPSPPNVDMATKIGMMMANLPYMISANLTATASEPSTSGTLSVV